MTFKKIVGWLHLWLGLISGIIVFIVCITGCIWVFNEEITALGEPWRFIERESRPYLSPSALQARIAAEVPDRRVSYISYKQGEAARVSLYKRDEYNMVFFLNPYSGEILHKNDYKKDEFRFFNFILKGHRFLWFPWKIGRPIVNYATLTFVVILVTGLVLWWPKNKSAAKQRFWFKWKDTTQWKRKNYDLHNIMGFYAMLFLLVIALTGITWGLDWFSKSVHWAVSGGKSQPEWERSVSDTLKKDIAQLTPGEKVDKLWNQIVSHHPDADQWRIDWPNPEEVASSISVYVYPKTFDGFQYDSYAFDQYTLEEIPRKYFGKYADANRAEKLERMYYGIHVGGILGLPGKVMAFLAALVGATLPVTGVYIWWGRRKKEKKTVAKTTVPRNQSEKAGPKSPVVKIKPKVSNPNK